ncbi:MAG: M48 family metallopeptidase [Bacteroidota bacterium]
MNQVLSLVKRIGLLLSLMLCLTASQAQFEKNYAPILFTGTIPEHFRESAREKSLAEIESRDRSQFSKRESKEFFVSSNYALNQVYLSGNVYFNDDLTAYVNRIVDHLLQDEPDLRADLKVQVSRFSTPNAASWRDGTILINIGLLSYLQNEAQLAFILAHEIAHFQEKHVLRSFLNQQDIKGGYFSGQTEADRMYSLLQYSRDQEFDADAKGLELYLKSDYQPTAAAEALRILEISNDDNEGEKQVSSLDLSQIFQVDSAQLCSPSKKKRVPVYFSRSNSKSTEEEDGKNMRTHPSIPDRIKALEKELSASDSVDKHFFLQPKSDFFRIRQSAFFELVGKYYQQFRYGRSLYICLLMMEQWPENEYLHVLSAKSMYWLAFYQHQEGLSKVMDDPNDYTGTPFGAYLCFLSDLETTDMEQVSKDYLQQFQEQYGRQDDIDFFLAKLMELYGDTPAALEQYRQYLSDHPDGTYQYYVERKLRPKK